MGITLYHCIKYVLENNNTPIYQHTILNKRHAMNAEAVRFFLLALAKLGFIFEGYLKTEFEFVHQQGCENNFHKLRTLKKQQ